MPVHGYYRFPTVYKDNIVFVSEDDLWSVNANGGTARRLTANLGSISHPFLSPDGKILAFSGREEGPTEVYVMDALGGPVRRVTFLGVSSNVIGWTPDGSSILFTSDHAQPFDRAGVVYSVKLEGGQPVPSPVGHAVSISFGPGGASVLGRNNNDPARWKRYRGGTAGDLWIDREGSGIFERLIELTGNLARPLWIGSRIFFLSDHDYIANLYSCTVTGEDLQRHTHHQDYFARFPNTDGKTIVYHAGGDLFTYDLETNTERRVDIDYRSPLVHRQRKFADASKYLEGFSLHPRGHSIAITTRGKSFRFGNWEGAVSELSESHEGPGRTRLSRWLNDGERTVNVCDRAGVEFLEVHHLSGLRDAVRLEAVDIGRALSLHVSPRHDHVIVETHRNELVFVDLANKSRDIIDRSEFGMIEGSCWSPDGRWVAYGFRSTQYTSEIRIWNRQNKEVHTVTNPVLHDTSPAFDPGGKYLYFIGQRELNPVYDSLHFDLGFTKGSRPYLLTLQAETRSPFQPLPRSLEEETKPKSGATSPSPEEEATGEASVVVSEETGGLDIDFDGIADRVVAFPVPEGLYGSIAGIKDKALFTIYPVEGALNRSNAGEFVPRGTLEVYDFNAQKHESLIARVSEFAISTDSKTLIYRSAKRLRVLAAGSKPDEKAGNEPGRKSGWIDLSRVRVEVDPATEWRQMAAEAWRLQRDYFWTENMSGVDWNAVWDRYSVLIDRVGTRGEFSDLMWEMQGELGTSHAYEMGGDYRTMPNYPHGFLGADLEWSEQDGGYRIKHIVQGTAGEARAQSPLLAPGVNARVGDVVLAINGRKASSTIQPNELLVNQADQEVVLTLGSGKDKHNDGHRDGNNEGHVEKERDVTIRALKSEFPARYREWVEANRRRVHEATNGRAGYVHIPDMGANGYAEFHRLYLAEVDRDALVVDVRFNRGGHVSPLLIEKLARKRIGYDVPRWGKPEPYPNYSVAGPIVAITNQWAGSDGDIFSHVFKLLKLGTLIGKRTWGGVIGIWPRNPLADGSMTTQPEFSFWFQDVGWAVENYGTDPDIDVDVTPQDYAAGRDPQMERAIEQVLHDLEVSPPLKPDFSVRPDLGLRSQ